MSEPRRPITYLDSPVRTGNTALLDADAATAVLGAARRIAIVGASTNPWRASHSVMAYLMSQGYECVPVNPNESQVLGRRCFPTLEAALAGTGGQPFDIVDVFRRPEYTPDIARSAVVLGSGTLWLQQRVINWQAAGIAYQGGLNVVMDRCTAIDHRRMRMTAR